MRRRRKGRGRGRGRGRDVRGRRCQSDTEEDE